MRNFKEFDYAYLRLTNRIINEGFWVENKRTGKRCLTVLGDMMRFNLSTGRFPLLTTKKIYTKPMVSELLGFIRGYNNAADFRNLGCNIWDANANKSKHWLDNPNRKGEDDLGRIYGVQARDWLHIRYEDTYDKSKLHFNHIDQLQNVVDKLNNKTDDRRLIVNHWNPGELDLMSLPPCHLQYIFGIREGYLDLCMIQRSCDQMLGVPFNIASYALLLELIAKITGFKAGVFTHFLWNIHIYEDQLPFVDTQLERVPYDAPTLWINPEIKTLKDLETWVTVDDIKFENYEHHPAIQFPFSE